MSLLENAKQLASGLGPGTLSGEETPMTNLLENCKRLDYSPDQPREENGRFGEGGSGTTRATVRISGNTHRSKDLFKKQGYTWNPNARDSYGVEGAWERHVDFPNAVTQANRDLPKGHPDRIKVGSITGEVWQNDTEARVYSQRDPAKSIRLHTGKDHAQWVSDDIAKRDRAATKHLGEGRDFFR
jgi:hypothetical protein